MKDVELGIWVADFGIVICFCSFFLKLPIEFIRSIGKDFKVHLEEGILFG
jgi:hypothetical protein